MKILVIRFSSIGDIVLTTPVLRALKKQIPAVELHFLTKAGFKTVVANNPHIDRVFTIDSRISEVLQELKSEQYDYIIDLHKNARTLALRIKLGKPAFTFPKLNWKKLLLVKLKKNLLPKLHIVERYFMAVEKLGVVNDNLPSEFYISEKDEVNLLEKFGLQTKSFVTIAIGAQFATKRMPLTKLKEIIEKIQLPVVLVGGPMDISFADSLLSMFPDQVIYSACGTYNLAQSASIVKQSKVLLTNDTGMMHIASCFQLPIVSVWGNTVPALGMYPYFPGNSELFSIHEVKGLNCRPCSKIGFQKCPKGHFNCMNLQDSAAISKEIKTRVGVF
jgi:ADP-heptose:LPS heptosyltransferase